MNASQAFRALVLAAAGVVAVVVLAASRIAGSAEAAVPPGYLLTWCGRFLGALYGLGGAAGGVRLGLMLLGAGMLLAGGWAGLRTVWTTRADLENRRRRWVIASANPASLTKGVSLSMSTRQRNSPPPASKGGGLRFVIVGTLVAVMLGGVAYALRTGGSPSPITSLPPAVVSGPSLGPQPLPVMSQAAPFGAALGLGDATAIPAEPVTGGARLSADYARLDFGQKGYGEPVNAEFTVKNVGDAPLVIDNVSIVTVAGC